MEYLLDAGTRFHARHVGVAVGIGARRNPELRAASKTPVEIGIASREVVERIIQTANPGLRQLDFGVHPTLAVTGYIAAKQPQHVVAIPAAMGDVIAEKMILASDPVAIDVAGR